ncbi:hypothetical protein SADUNF_Sadunf08G0038100 [Salix dunnii]|uniref:Uncharacterized protein n=1 Tax=Salix dunnii TaxID=1413687 RepID=A0A835MT98_9ROSI|nr:hypothetical protein SADUNF_Sadunf08G0038100 [Salix dunnii]
MFPPATSTQILPSGILYFVESCVDFAARVDRGTVDRKAARVERGAVDRKASSLYRKVVQCSPGFHADVAVAFSANGRIMHLEL